MAETAKQRTEVDYSSMSNITNEMQIIQNVYNRMINRGATREELDNFKHLIKKYDATNYKPPIKDCTTCKYYSRDEHSPCIACNNNDKWEAKENE